MPEANKEDIISQTGLCISCDRSPISPHSACHLHTCVQITLSEASARHSQNRASNHTLEKLHVRCFETLALCSLPGHWHWMGRLDMNSGRWEMNKGFDTPNWSAAQAFLEHYKKLGKLPQVGGE